MKLKDMMSKRPVSKPETVPTTSIQQNIYDFAAISAQRAEAMFNLTTYEGDLVYYSVITALKYLKHYPED